MEIIFKSDPNILNEVITVDARIEAAHIRKTGVITLSRKNFEYWVQKYERRKWSNVELVDSMLVKEEEGEYTWDEFYFVDDFNKILKEYLWNLIADALLKNPFINEKGEKIFG